MTDGRSALLRLMAWLSPAFPTGSFSYSQGLEGAVHDGLVSDADELGDWLSDILQHGAAWNEAVLLAESWRLASAGDSVAELAELAEALAGSAERHLETTLQGAAFTTASSVWPSPVRDHVEACPYPVAVGAVAARHGIALGDAMACFLQAYASNMIQAGIRLSLLGQSDALRILAGLEPAILKLAVLAAHSNLDDLGSCTTMAEIASLRHEAQYSRLFRS